MNFWQCRGSGIRCFFDPGIRIRDGKNLDPGSEMIIQDRFSRELKTVIRLKIFKFFFMGIWIREPGSFWPGSGIRDGKLRSVIRQKHPGCATLFLAPIGFIYWNCVNHYKQWLKRFLCRETGSDRVCADGCGLRRSLCRHQGKKIGYFLIWTDRIGFLLGTAPGIAFRLKRYCLLWIRISMDQ